MKKPLHFLLGLFLALTALTAKAQTPQIVKITPDSVNVYNLGTIDLRITVRGAHFFGADTFRTVFFQAPQCRGSIYAGPPFFREYFIYATGVSIVNDSTVACAPWLSSQLLTSYLDIAVVTVNDTIWKNRGFKAINSRVPQRFSVSPLQGRAGQTLDVVASGMQYPDVDQTSPTLFVDFVQPWSVKSTNFSQRLGSSGQMLANITVPAGAAIGCYDVILRDGANCQVLNDAFCVTPGTVSLPGRISGTVYEDSNRNCIRNAAERGLKGIVIEATPGPYYAVTNEGGNYTLEVPLGTFTLKQLAHAYSYALPSCNAAGQQAVAGGGAAGRYDFGDTLQANNNLDLYMDTWRTRPGFEAFTSIKMDSYGDSTMSGLIKVKMDTILHFVSADYPFTWQGDTLVFPFSVTPSYSGNWGPINIVSRIRTDVSLLGDTLYNQAWVTCSTREITYEDNTAWSRPIIRGSYDPNDKAVWPAGKFFESDSVLNYRIRFQNTGTDTAYFVVVRDTLSQHLDVSSVISKSGSHDNTFSIHGQNIVEWRMMDIMLPDSNVNEKASHGFVEFSIKRKEGLAMGTQIDNRAGIYFDFNPPVMTNYASTTLSTPVRVREQAGTNGVIVYPNPMGKGQSILRVSGRQDLEGAKLQLLDAQGRQAMPNATIASGQAILSGKRLTAGIYFYRILHQGRAAATGKLVVE